MPEDNELRSVSATLSEVGDAIDLRAYWRAIWRRRWLVVPFFLATVLVTTVVTLRLPKIYDATCTIIIDLTAPRILDKDQVQDVVETGTGGLWYSREYYETQYKVITSRAVAQRVVDRLGLSSNAAFLGVEPSKSGPPGSPTDPVVILLKNLKVEPVKDSRIVRLRYEDRDPELAALVANTVAEAYITENLAVKTSTTATAGEWLERQLADLEQKLEESGKALFDFKKQHDIVATSWEDRQSMVSQRLTQVNDALTKVRVRRAELQARNEQVEALSAALERGRLGPEVESLEPIAASIAIQQLKMKYFEAESECADLRLRYLDDHPRLEACVKRLGLARQALRDQIQTLLSAARKEFEEIKQTERNLAQLLGEAKADALGLNQYEREYLELKRTQDNNQRLYELVLKRLKDTGVAGMLQVSNVRILDRARPSTKPVRPDIKSNFIVALIAGVLGGIALALLVDRMDRTVTSQQQVEEGLGLAFLGIIPSIDRRGDGRNQDLVVHTHPKSAVAECLRSVRTNLLFMSPEKPLKTVLVTSAGPQEGKTTTATSLAITLAESGSRVLLVDADMRRPRLHRIFGVESRAGLSSLILGEGRLTDMAHATEVPNLSLLPCGPVPPNPAELLHTENFRRVIAEAARSYDRVIIDSPPVGVVADAVIIGTHADGSLFVLKTGKTSRDVARMAVRQLLDVNARILGGVLNDLDLADQRYGYYSHYYQYGYYYGEGGKAGAAAGAKGTGS